MKNFIAQYGDISRSQGGLVFVCGTADGIIKVSGRRHNCDDLKATILAVDPIKFVYRGRSVCHKIKLIFTNHLHYDTSMCSTRMKIVISYA